MPVAPTYPGVYIEEIPSGVRTITGVGTSITAFIGRTARGPVNDPVAIFSFGDFERRLGGLSPVSPLSSAVRDFFLNGGSQALVVRLFRPPDGQQGGGQASFTSGDLRLLAASPGEWGNRLSIKVDHDGITDEVAEQFGLGALGADQLFNLTVIERPPLGQREIFRNVSLHGQAGSRRLDHVLGRESNLAHFDGLLADDATPAAPADTPDDQDPTNPANFPQGQPAAGISFFAGGLDSDTLEEGDYLGLDPADNSPLPRAGISALDQADLFNLLCVPPDQRGGDVPIGVYGEALQYCVRRRAMLIVDPPFSWGANPAAVTELDAAALAALNLSGPAARNAAIYFPRVAQADPLREGQIDTFPACGIIAGVIARTDAQRGVWKAPAGLEAAIAGVAGLQVTLTDGENGQLNQLGINCLRFFQVGGRVIWGARTLRGADQLADEYKYIPVRRTALFIEESLYRGLQWVVFEPNDEPLWAQIRLNVGAFMNNLFRQGAFQGRTPREAYLVKCDRETTTQNDINLGIVNILVGFAPLRPAEFVIVKIQQIAGQIAV
ncbi:MAG: phage tail sheath family protein [Chloroflexales bacterium]|nr:phage tail sheath family protein [Chloroflexales bacterium]